MIKSKSKWYNNTFVLYTLSFVIVSLIAFCWFAIFHKSFIWNEDGLKQHYSLLIKLRYMCVELFHGNGFSFWSHDIGLGGDTIGNMAIVLCDPFNYIAAVFPPKLMAMGYSLAVLLRLYVAGWAMIAFLKYHGYSKRNCLIGGIGYAFSAWAISVINHGFFLNPLILFPLLILGIDYVFDCKKPYLLIFSISMSLITYLYFAYMSAIFCLLYVVVRFWLGEHDMERTFKEFMRLFGKLCLSIAVACMVTAPIIITTAYTILSVNKPEAMHVPFFLSLKELLRYLPSLIGNFEISGNYTYMGTNALFVATIPFMFINRKKKNLRVPIALFFFCFVMMAFPIWGSFINGLNYSVGRWCYMLAFFFVWAAVGTLEEMERAETLNYRALIIWVGVLATWLIIAKIFTNAFSGNDAVIGLLTLLMMLLIFWLFTQGKKKAMYILLLINIGIVPCLRFSPYVQDLTESHLGFVTPYRIYEHSLLKAEEAISDTDFYRVDFGEHLFSENRYNTASHGPSNENLYWGAKTVFSFLSTVDGRWVTLNKDVANSEGASFRMMVFSNDKRSRLNFLEGVKYYLSSQESGREKYAGYGYTTSRVTDGVVIQKSDYDAGLGYVYPKVIGEKQYQTFDPLDKEQVMMQAAVISDEDITALGIEGEVIDPQEITLDTTEVEYVVDEESEIQPEGNQFVVSKDSQVLDLTIPQCENCELYVEFRGLKKTPFTLQELREAEIGSDAKTTGYQKAKFNKNYLSYQPYGDFEFFATHDGIRGQVRYFESVPQAITDRTVFLSNVGYHQQTDGKISIRFNYDGKYSYDSLKVYAVSQENFDEQARALTAQRFTMTKESADLIEGTVNAQQEGILYLNLPYHPGWKMYVDGEEQDLIAVNTAFCGTKISEGEHEIILTYRPIAYRISLLLCCMGILCIAGMTVVYKRRELKDKQKS